MGDRQERATALRADQWCFLLVPSEERRKRSGRSLISSLRRSDKGVKAISFGGKKEKQFVSEKGFE